MLSQGQRKAATLPRAAADVTLPTMFVRLARQKRVQAGWFVALLYLFCVLAPALTLALGGTLPWLANDLKATVVANAHDHSAHEDGDAHAGHKSGAVGSHQHEHGGKGSAGPCCAMLCLSTIVADLPSISKPEQPKSVRLVENYRRLPDRTPPRLYRPPIA